METRRSLAQIPKFESDQPTTASPAKARFSYKLCDLEISSEKAKFGKMIVWGLLITSGAVLSILSIYWASLHQVNLQGLEGIIVDFDQDIIGQAVTASFREVTGRPDQLSWTFVDPSRFAGPQPIADAIVKEKHWVAIVGE